MNHCQITRDEFHGLSQNHHRIAITPIETNTDTTDIMAPEWPELVANTGVGASLGASEEGGTTGIEGISVSTTTGAAVGLVVSAGNDVTGAGVETTGATVGKDVGESVGATVAMQRRPLKHCPNSLQTQATISCEFLSEQLQASGYVQVSTKSSKDLQQDWTSTFPPRLVQVSACSLVGAAVGSGVGSGVGSDVQRRPLKHWPSSQMHTSTGALLLGAQPHAPIKQVLGNGSIPAQQFSVPMRPPLSVHSGTPFGVGIALGSGVGETVGGSVDGSGVGLVVKGSGTHCVPS